MQNWNLGYYIYVQNNLFSQIAFNELKIKLERNGVQVMMKFKQTLKLKNSCSSKWYQKRRELLKILTQMITDKKKILKSYQLGGMESLFHIGYINYTVLVKNSLVKFVEDQVIGVEKHLMTISTNGDIPMD